MAITEKELETAYATLEEPLYNFALRWTWNPALAQDLVQDAFVRIWKYRDEVDGMTLKALLYKTTQNLAINERRKRKVREAVSVLDWFLGEDSTSTGTNAEREFVKAENLAELKTALDALPDELRKTLLMCEFSDMSYEEVAQALAIPAGTVASRKNRAMQKLKQQLGENHG